MNRNIFDTCQRPKKKYNNFNETLVKSIEKTLINLFSSPEFPSDIA